MALPDPKIEAYGDAAVLLRYDVFGYDAQVNQAVLSMAAHLRTQSNWVDVVCGYDSVLATFNPRDMRLGAALNRLKVALGRLDMMQEIDGPIIDIPVHYGGEHGPDMGNIMESSGLSEEAIIRIHSSQIYNVCMMGFIPGFAFLSEAPQVLHHPRQDTPRLSVPAGSIGIAGWQTGIYGLESPGGWQIIGRTPATIFDVSRNEPFLLKAGDRVRFIPQTVTKNRLHAPKAKQTSAKKRPGEGASND